MIMEGLLLGLSSGASCLASCAPFIAPLLAVEGGSTRARRFSLLGMFLAGRFVAYAATGLIAGSLGAVAAGYLAPELDRALLRAGWALGGFFLLAGGLSLFKSHPFCARLAAMERPALSSLVLGLAAGLNLCPPFVAAVTRAAKIGPLGGLGYFALFFVGTSLWILILGLAPALKGRAPELRKIARLVMVMMGVYFLVVLGMLGWN
jgi:sulfite exporter TauE/SafE